MIINKISPVSGFYCKNKKINSQNQNAAKNINETKAAKTALLSSVNFCGFEHKTIKNIISDAKQYRARAIYENRTARGEYDSALLKFSNGIGHNFRNVYDDENNILRSFERGESEVSIVDYKKDGTPVLQTVFQLPVGSGAQIYKKDESEKYIIFNDGKPSYIGIESKNQKPGFDCSEFSFEFEEDYCVVNKNEEIDEETGNFSAQEVYAYIDDKMYYFENPVCFNDSINWSRAYEIDSSDKIREVTMQDECVRKFFL